MKGQQQTCWNDQQSKHEHTEVEDRVCALTLSLNMPIDEVLANADASKGIIRIWVLPERTQVFQPASTYWDVPSAENRYTANKDSVFRHIVYMVLSWHGIQHCTCGCHLFMIFRGWWADDILIVLLPVSEVYLGGTHKHTLQYTHSECRQ